MITRTGNSPQVFGQVINKCDLLKNLTTISVTFVCVGQRNNLVVTSQKLTMSYIELSKSCSSRHEDTTAAFVNTSNTTLAFSGMLLTFPS